MRIGLVSRIQNYILNIHIFDMHRQSFLQRFNFTYIWSKIIQDACDILRFQNGKICWHFSSHFRSIDLKQARSCSECYYIWQNLPNKAIFGFFLKNLTKNHRAGDGRRIFDRTCRVQQSYYNQIFKEKSIWCQTLKWYFSIFKDAAESQNLIQWFYQES